MSEINDIEEKVNEVLKTIFVPEIPVNIYDLGLIYKVEVVDDSSVMFEMTLTAPNCPMAGDILDQVKERVELIDEVSDVFVNLTFDPPWDPERMTDEAKLELGFL
jgi:FeS assembly SUF system protein